MKDKKKKLNNVIEIKLYVIIEKERKAIYIWTKSVSNAEWCTKEIASSGGSRGWGAGVGGRGGGKGPKRGEMGESGKRGTKPRKWRYRTKWGGGQGRRIPLKHPPGYFNKSEYTKKGQEGGLL